MYEKEKDLFSAYVRKQMSRRELLDRVARLGLSAALANTLLGAASTRALAQNFDWKKYQGESIKLLLNQHPYADAMIANIESFKELTGMNVSWDLFPEDVYFDRVTAALSSRSSEYDAFMTGAYQTWQYGPANWLVDLNEYLNDPEKTSPDHNWEDVIPGLRASTAWSGVPGEPLGGEGAKQWCLPWGFEMNSISYNRAIFDKLGLEPPKTMDELIETAIRITKEAGGPYGIGVRGSRSWATIHPGFLSGYTNFGARDFVVEDGKLKAAMNSDVAKKFTADWVRMIQEAGPKNWATYTWYQVGADLGAGASGMIYDADILGYFSNGGDNKEAGHIGFAAFAPNPQAERPTPNVWIWSLAMSNFSTKKDATWNFLQWATSVDHALFGARKMDFVNPVRQSVFKDTEFRDRIAKNYPGYLEQYEASYPGAKIYFTPQPLFFNLTTDWAAALQRMVAGEVEVTAALDELAANFDRQLQQSGLQ